MQAVLSPQIHFLLEAFAEARHLDEREVYVLLSRRADAIDPNVQVRLDTRAERVHPERREVELDWPADF